jgi:hypothetical protein
MPEVVAYLLPFGYDPDIKDQDGRTAKMVADDGSDDDFRAVSVLLSRYIRSREASTQPKVTTSFSQFELDETVAYYKAEQNVAVQVDEDMLAASAADSHVITRLDAFYDKKHKIALDVVKKKLGHIPTELTNTITPLATSMSTKSFYDSMREHLKSMHQKVNSGVKHHKLLRSKIGFMTSTAKIAPFGIEKEEIGPPKFVCNDKNEVVPYDPASSLPKEIPPQILYIELESILPKSSQSLETVLVIEHCCDCLTHNSSLWHDERKYQSIADKLLMTISRYLLDEGFAVRLLAFKIRMERHRFRYGAFEVSIATFANDAWETCKLHSKLESRRYKNIKIKCILKLKRNVYV